MTVDLDRSTLTEAVAALAAGEVSSTELLAAQLDRIDVFNPSVNAVVAFDIDRALAAAAAADQRRASGDSVGPLEGIPLTIKDTFETEGLVTTSGAPQRAEYVPTRDADVVRAIRSNGGVLFGKTNVPLYAGDHQTYNEVYGLTRNGWHPDRTAGGSSGGAAVAVACGFSLGEVGSDIGGSIRVPAHFNGVFGLKPSWGVISSQGHVPEGPDLAVVGPLGRSVDDLSLLLDVCSSVNPMSGFPGAALPSAGSVDLGRLRVGLWADDPIAPVDRATAGAVAGVAQSLEALGAQVSPSLRPSMAANELHDIYSRLLFSVTGSGIPEHVRTRMIAATADTPDDLDAGDSSTFDMRNMRDSVSSHRSWFAANARRQKAVASWAELFESVDVMVMPVSQTQAFPHNVDVRYADRVVRVDDEDRGYHELLFWSGLATMPLLPSIVLPLGQIDGLPMGVQIVGPRWSDLRLLAIAASMSEALALRFEPPVLVTG